MFPTALRVRNGTALGPDSSWPVQGRHPGPLWASVLPGVSNQQTSHKALEDRTGFRGTDVSDCIGLDLGITVCPQKSLPEAPFSPTRPRPNRLQGARTPVSLEGGEQELPHLSLGITPSPCRTSSWASRSFPDSPSIRSQR